MEEILSDIKAASRERAARLIKVDALPRSAGTCHLGQEATEIDKRRSSSYSAPAPPTLPTSSFSNSLFQKRSLNQSDDDQSNELNPFPVDVMASRQI